MVNDLDPYEGGGFSDDEVDALAYSYVLSHGYEGALTLMQELLATRGGDQPPDAVTDLCQRILDAIHDEAATIARILDRLVPALRNGALLPSAALSLPPTNPIDRRIGARLRQRRSQLGLNLTVLSAGLGLTPDELAAIEEGARRLDGAGLQKAAIHLDVPGTYFFAASPSDDDASGALQ
jgi:hypothetical protein